MVAKDLTREELFVLVWEKPASEVAAELGFSDVALGKLCKRLQVPKPPRGYWAKIQAGKKPRRPPLKAFREELETKRKKDVRKRYVAQLSKLQTEFFKRALNELAEVGVDISEVDITYDGVRSLAPSMAAQVLILVQNRYDKWVEERGTSAQSHQGAFSSIKSLVSKLLPIAESQVVVFEEERDKDYRYGDTQTVIVRLSPELQQKISQMNRLVRENQLAYTAMELSKSDGVLSTTYLHSPRSYVSLNIELCVSRHEIWIRCKKVTSWNSNSFETTKLPLQQLLPVELIEANEIRLPAVVSHARWSPYADRLEALEQADEMHEKLISDLYKMDETVSNEHLAIMDKLMLGSDAGSPFYESRRAFRALESELEKWESVLEAERTELTQEILGIEQGDIVVAERDGKLVRIVLDRAYLYVGEKTVNFHLSGRRFRKDGLPGKRDEVFYLQTENDLK